MEQDHVDMILRQWALERPDLDTSAVGVIGRISRLERHFARSLQENFAAFGLNSGEFDVLATLRRAGAPHQLTPGELLNMLMLSSGAMTNRLDQLEAAGLVRRLPDPHDRRGVLVELTSQGFLLIDQAIAAHVARENRLLDSLTPAERENLAALLRTLLIGFERDAPDS